jgi:hypothetical protein
MIQVRSGVFETNSSSTHSITMCLKADHDAWKEGKVYFLEGHYGSTSEHADKVFVTREELIDVVTVGKYPVEESAETLLAMTDEEFEEFLEELNEDDVVTRTYDEYQDGDLETFEDSFTTPSGEVVIAFGEYGSEY